VNLISRVSSRKSAEIETINNRALWSKTIVGKEYKRVEFLKDHQTGFLTSDAYRKSLWKKNQDGIEFSILTLRENDFEKVVAVTDREIH